LLVVVKLFNMIQQVQATEEVPAGGEPKAQRHLARSKASPVKIDSRGKEDKRNEKGMINKLQVPLSYPHLFLFNSKLGA
jgi:hypothetical protein